MQIKRNHFTNSINTCHSSIRFRATRVHVNIDNSCTSTYSSKPIYTSLARFRNAHTWTYYRACTRVYYDAASWALAVTSRPRSSTIYSVVSACAGRVWGQATKDQRADSRSWVWALMLSNLSSFTLSRSPSPASARTLVATSRVASPPAHMVRWPCVSPAGSRERRGSLLVSEGREHPRVLQSPISLYHFPLATRTRPHERPLC